MAWLPQDSDIARVDVTQKSAAKIMKTEPYNKEGNHMHHCFLIPFPMLEQ